MMNETGLMERAMRNAGLWKRERPKGSRCWQKVSGWVRRNELWILVVALLLAGVFLLVMGASSAADLKALRKEVRELGDSRVCPVCGAEVSRTEAQRHRVGE